MTSPTPKVGDWYQTLEGATLEVVAMDPDDMTIEIQYFDGAIEEYDQETWEELELRPAEPPEDWSGSLDLMPEDYGVDQDHPAGEQHADPLGEIEGEE
ncbi:MAG: DUF6763 family protein [Candidatus Sedimenticola sp. PURPLELP]